MTDLANNLRAHSCGARGLCANGALPASLLILLVNNNISLGALDITDRLGAGIRHALGSSKHSSVSFEVNFLGTLLNLGELGGEVLNEARIFHAVIDEGDLWASNSIVILQHIETLGRELFTLFLCANEDWGGSLQGDILDNGFGFALEHVLTVSNGCGVQTSLIS